MEQDILLKGLTMIFTAGHIGHIYAEDNPARKLLLKAYAWKEMEILRGLFYVSKLSLFNYAVFRKPFYHLFCKFLGTRGVVCQAATLSETYEFIDSLPEGHSLAVGPCRCRAGNRNCEHEIMTDIVIGETAKIWYEDLFPDDYYVISREEAKEICRRSREEGMFQTIDRHMYFKDSENYFVICNCCKESCVPVVAYRLFKEENFYFHPSGYVAGVTGDKCEKCGKCIEACPFEERKLNNDGHTQVLNCQGCGICADLCPGGAAEMVPLQ